MGCIGDGSGDGSGDGIDAVTDGVLILSTNKKKCKHIIIKIFVGLKFWRIKNFML